jgi:hypothetical protein
MMNKLNVRYILILIFFVALVLLISKGRTPFGKGNTSFAVKPEVGITRIDLTQGEKKLTIEKSGENWLINNKNEARKSAVQFMIRTLREIRIKSPVSPEIFKNEIVGKKTDPVRVAIYAKRKMVKSFLVYKTGSNIYGNIMKIRASSKPFILYIPGYEDNIGTHFVVNDLFWKPYMVFHLLPSQIESIALENFSDSTSSFMISCTGDLQLSEKGRNVSGWDTLKVRRYVSYFTAISFETWVFDLDAREKNEIESTPPLYRIKVRNHDGKEIILTVWERWIPVGGGRSLDTDRVWAKTNENDGIFVMRYFDLDPVLKKSSYFFSE